MEKYFILLFFVVLYAACSGPAGKENNPVKTETLAVEENKTGPGYGDDEKINDPGNFDGVKDSAAAPAAETLDRKNDTLFEGYINEKLPVVFYLHLNDYAGVAGKYAYKNNGQFIWLNGDIENDSLFLDELNAAGAISGKMAIDLKSFPEMKGTWRKPDGTGKLPVRFRKAIAFNLKDKNNSSPGFQKEKIAGTDKTSAAKINYEVLYNLNGVFTEAVYTYGYDGFESIDYKSTNLYTGKPLQTEDVFKPEYIKEIARLVYEKVKEECPEQVPSLISATDPADYSQLVAVINNRFHFRSTCDRQIGFFLGTRTVDFSLEELKKYMY